MIVNLDNGYYIDSWWDRHTRSYITQVKDADGYEIENSYSGNKIDREADIKYFMDIYKKDMNESLMLNEAKEDIEKFVNKFGQEAYDNFQRLKQRIKQVKDENGNPTSLDILYHYKNTSPEQMNEIIQRAENREYEKGYESKIDIEGKIIPRPVNTKKLVYNKDGKKVYLITDYTDMIDVGDDTGWCIAGRYEYYDEPKGVCKVSQAKQYFKEYMENNHLDGYYVLIDGNEKFCLLFNADSEQVNSVWNKADHAQNAKSFLEEYPFFENILWAPIPLAKYDGKNKVPKRAEKIEVEDGVTKIGNMAFADCHSVQEIIIPDSVTSIGTFAFSNCSVKTINVPDSVTTIGLGAFSDCPNLIEVKLPNNIERINAVMFMNDPSLTSVYIPDSVKTVKEQIFDFCRSLKEVSIPSHLADDENLAEYKDILKVRGNGDKVEEGLKKKRKKRKKEPTLPYDGLHPVHNSVILPDAAKGIGRFNNMASNPGSAGSSSTGTSGNVGGGMGESINLSKHMRELDNQHFDEFCESLEVEMLYETMKHDLSNEDKEVLKRAKTAEEANTYLAGLLVKDKQKKQTGMYEDIELDENVAFELNPKSKYYRNSNFNSLVNYANDKNVETKWSKGKNRLGQERNSYLKMYGNKEQFQDLFKNFKGLEKDCKRLSLGEDLEDDYYTNTDYDVMTYNDYIASQFDGFDGAGMDELIALSSKYAKALHSRKEDMVVVTLLGDIVYDIAPRFISDEEVVQEIPNTSAELYVFDNVAVVDEVVGGEDVLWFKSELDAYNYYDYASDLVRFNTVEEE